ncbi:hypothetical protein HY025_02140 [Candidatus Daviesbacteria bacterium]|nr:hypothetical protein [Candidatus Daviesbacteria bacterium]
MRLEGALKYWIAAKKRTPEYLAGDERIVGAVKTVQFLRRYFGDELFPLSSQQVSPDLEIDILTQTSSPQLVLRKNGELILPPFVEQNLVIALVSNNDFLSHKKGNEIFGSRGGFMMPLGRLRVRIEDDPKHPKHLRTVRGEGILLENYYLAVPVDSVRSLSNP